MTNEYIERMKGEPISVKDALVSAYEAGCSRMIGSSANFTQIHADRATVVIALMERIKKGGGK